LRTKVFSLDEVTVTTMRASENLFSFWRAAAVLCLIAGFAGHKDAYAQQSPRSIVPQLQEQFGLNEGQVRGALGALLVFAREKLPKVEFDRFAQRIPNADAAMQEVKMRGVVTGPIDDRDEYEEVLVKLGMGESTASQFGSAVLGYLNAAGYGPERDMLARILD
jgi:hypothetical protein